MLRRTVVFLCVVLWLSSTGRPLAQTTADEPFVTTLTVEQMTGKQGVVRRALPGPYQDVLDFAYYSGWRKREILGLWWGEVDDVGGVVRLSYNPDSVAVPSPNCATGPPIFSSRDR